MVLAPGCGGAGEDGIPDDGLGDFLAGLLRGVDGFDVEEDLFGVPIEERAQVWAKMC